MGHSAEMGKLGKGQLVLDVNGSVEGASDFLEETTGKKQKCGFWNEVNADNTDWGVTGGLKLKSGAAGSNELIPRPRFLIR